MICYTSLSRRRRIAVTNAVASASIFAALVGSTVTGCDRKSDVPPPALSTSSSTVPSTSTATTAPAATFATTRPTTQELVAGPRKPLVLNPLPLAMDVPQSWTVVTAGGSSWVEGPTPHGNVRIQLMSMTNQPLTAQTLELLNQRTQKEAKDNPNKLVFVPLHPVGTVAKASERREFDRNTVLNDQGQPEMTDVVEWEVKVYVPQAENFAVDMLDFSPISKAVYEQDKDFIEKVLATLRYDATKGLLQ